MHAGAAADLVERHIRDDDAAEHQQRHLHDVGERDRLQAAVQRVEQREQRRAPMIAIWMSRPAMAFTASAPSHRIEVRFTKMYSAEPEHRHHVAHRRAVTLLEELRHRVDAVLEEHRQEPLADDDQRERRHPFVGGDRHAHHVAGAGHADDLLGGDVRGDQRGADGPPGQRATGEEIVLRVLLVFAFLARHPLRQHENADRVDRQDGDVQSCQIHVNPLLQRRRWTPCCLRFFPSLRAAPGPGPARVSSAPRVYTRA